ncbi:MAG: kinase [Magnetococcales bacterium]|nr:kinase [Magnetococcales bacterium]
MIISRTPFRISFFGGGTDYPAYYREHGGAVLATTINRYCYLNCRYLPAFFNHTHRIVYSKTELVNSVGDIQHPAVREALRMLNIDHGVEIHHNGDLPARSGLGSSSSFAVSILHALYALQGKLVSKEHLARQAIELEQNRLNESVGVQDQVMTAFGGLNRLEITTNDKYLVSPLPLSIEKTEALENRLLFCFTGVSRTASQIAQQKIAAIPKKQQELHTMRQMVDQAAEILCNGSDIDDFGRLLHESWQLKRSLVSSIAPDFIHEMYNAAKSAGALGGKLLGAGGGGFMIFYVRPQDRANVVKALSKLLIVPIKFEYSGSQIIFNQK